MMFSSFFWIALIGMTLVASSYAESDPSLVLYYRFDLPGSEVRDLSDQRNDGKIVNGEFLDEFQGRQGVLRLNGTSAYIDCGDAPSLQLEGDTTFEMWIRQNGEPKGSWAAIFTDEPAAGLSFYIAYGHALAFYYRGPDFDGIEMMAQPFPRAILNGEWAHIAIVFESPRIRCYRNGKLVRDAFMPVSGVTTKNQSAKKLIGGAKDAFAPIDLTEFRIYRRALSADEIARHAADEPADSTVSEELAVEPNWYRGELTARWVRKNAEAAGQEAVFALSENGTQTAKATETFAKVSGNDSPRFAAVAGFSLKGLEGKTVTVKAGGHSRDITLNKPDWIREKAGKTDGILPPWTPIEVTRNGKMLGLKVWGRNYELGPLLFPRQIESAGSPLLFQPVTLEAKAKGIAAVWTPGPITIKEQEAAYVLLEQKLTAGSFTLNIRARLEYDGYMVYDLNLVSAGDTQLERLVLNVPLVSDKAQLCYADRAFPENPQIPIAEWFSGAVTKPLDFRFSPNLWIGDNERGLTWQAESDEFWHNSDPLKAITITPGTKSTALRANFIDQPRDLKSGQVLHYKFALLATPAKPLRRDAWDLRIARYEPWGKEIEIARRTLPDGTPEAKAIAEVGVRNLYVNINDVWPWPMPGNEVFAKATHEMSGAIHGAGLKFHNYTIHQRVPVTVPEFDLYGLDMSNRPLAQHIEPMGNTDERPGPIAINHGADSQATAFMCPKSEPLQDAYLHALDQRLKTFGDDGVYLDGTVHIVPCRNTAHGCGYHKDGRLHPTFPVFAVREMMKRIYSLVKSRDPDGLVDVHCSFGYNPAGLTYADVMWTGEHWFHLRDTGTDYISGELPLDKFRTEFSGRQLGIAAETLHYRLRNPMKVAATSLLHDISPRYSVEAFDNNTGNVDPYFALVPKLWKLRDEFGADQAEKLFYYENQAYVTVKGEQGYATLLKHPSKGTLALVSNLSRNNQELIVSFDLGRLGLTPQAVQAVDPLSGKDVPMTADGQVTVPLGSEEWKYLWLKPIPKE